MRIFNRATPSRKMPANASRTTARKAYATAVAYERKGIAQRMNNGRSVYKEPNINRKKTGVSSLKIAGQMAKGNDVRQAYRSNVASADPWDKTRKAFKATVR
jgi:hypothetical protein